MTELIQVRENIPEPIAFPAISKSRTYSKVVVRRILADEEGAETDDEESLKDTCAKFLLIGETTDISLAKWIKETNAGAELKALRQAIIDKKFTNIPPSYKLFQNELKTDMGLVFVANKLAVPRSLREWVKQIAHGDHASRAKMTEMLYWPNKAKDLESKAKECIVCFQAGKNLRSVIPQKEKISFR